MTQRKYRPGRRFRTVGELVDWIEKKGFVYLHASDPDCRPTHYAWAGSMTVHTLGKHIRWGACEAWRIARRAGVERRNIPGDDYPWTFPTVGVRTVQRRKGA